MFRIVWSFTQNAQKMASGQLLFLTLWGRVDHSRDQEEELFYIKTVAVALPQTIFPPQTIGYSISIL